MSRWIALAALGAIGVAVPAGIAMAQVVSAPDWQPLDPQNTLVIDTSKGRIVVVMQPDLAPQAVARVKLLSHERVYDGLLFHRVIDHFVDQTGNPNNHDGGASNHPDLAAELVATLPATAIDAVSTHNSDGLTGFIGPNPVAAVQSRNETNVRAWGLYCAGVVGMGRQADPNSANSEIFFMRDACRRLDHAYTVWGRVIDGMDVVRAVAVGDPPAAPDKMVRVRLMAELAPGDRPRLLMLDARSPAFADQIAKARRDQGADFTPCEVAIITKVAP